MEIHKQAQKAELFRQLHHGPPVLMLVNVWDVATARFVERPGSAPSPRPARRWPIHGGILTASASAGWKC